MADDEAARARRERIDVSEYAEFVWHTGTREKLIAAGLAKANQFPGEPGCGKTSTEFPAEGERRKMSVRRRSTYLFDVVIYRSYEEAKIFKEKQRANVARGSTLDRRSVAQTPEQLDATRRLEPLRLRLEGCSGLFTQAAKDVEKKLMRIRTAHEMRFKDPEVQERIQESARELRDSSTLGRTIEDMERVRASITEIVRELKELTGAP